MSLVSTKTLSDHDQGYYYYKEKLEEWITKALVANDKEIQKADIDNDFEGRLLLRGKEKGFLDVLDAMRECKIH